jgi:hypothetical protein
VDDGVDLEALEEVGDLFGVEQGADVELGFGNGVAKAGGEIVENGDLVAALGELVDGMRADVARTACN